MDAPGRQETVKALSWQLLYGNYRPRLGDAGWTELAQSCGAPAFRSMDADVDVPMDPFNQALLFIDRRLGNGDGSLIEDVARLSVERWGSMFRNLVKQLAGRPNKMLEIFAREVHPYFLADPRASKLVAARDGWAKIRMDNGLVEAFKVGLVRGFVELTGADVRIRKGGDGAYDVEWTVRTSAAEPSPWALFVNAVRLPFLTATMVPVMIGAAIAAFDVQNGTVAGHFDWGLLGLTILGVAFFHLGTNTANDYFDHRSGADEANFTPTPFSGGSRVIQRGLLDAKTMGVLAAVFYVLGTLVGLVLVVLLWPKGLTILWLGIAGFLLGFLYTAPPARLAHRGIGELAVAIGFGPLIVMGAYFVQTRTWSQTALFASLPVGFLIAAVLYINEFPDKEGDARVGKRTLIVRLPDRAAVLGYHALLTLAYVCILAGVIVPNPATHRPYFPVYTLAALLTVPLAIKASIVLNRNYRFPYRLVPANAFTILIHLTTGLLFFAGYVAAILLPGMA
jgi:1,4-dihydroxy-2-naphthoate octaprenyltransferase